MHDLEQVRAAWVEQPHEPAPVDLSALQRKTRSEISGSIGAAVFFAVVLAWRVASERDFLVLSGCAALLLWAAVTAFRYRRDFAGSSFAKSGVEHYRDELVRRRDHLRSAWIWHGPLLLALVLGGAALARRVVPGRIWEALPVVLVLAVFTATGMRRRFQQARELQTEIDHLNEQE